MSTKTSPPEPDPDTEVPRPLMGYHVPGVRPAAQPKQIVDVPDEEVEDAFAAPWKKMERCE